ncbi:MAG: DUF2029 domain-containing protein [Planctomycetes bacterium]|nr:DUF2029 domain-containing protein [Planctomycetota bacterium]
MDDQPQQVETGGRVLDRLEAALRRGRWLALPLLLAALVPLTYRAATDPKGDTRFYVRAAERFVAGAPLYRAEDGATTSYTYPPPFAAACVWTLALPYPAVRVAWLALMTACALGAAAVALRWLREAGPRGGRPHLLLLLALLPLLRFGMNDLAHGQTNWLLALLVPAALLWLQRGRDLRAGAFLGAALVIKPTAWPLLAWVALSGRGRALAGLASAAVVAMLPVVARYGPAGALGEVGAWLEASPRFADLEALAPGNASLASTLNRLLSGTTTKAGLEPLLLALDPAATRPWARAAAVLIVAAAFAWLLARRRREPLAPAALLPLAALLSPVTWKAHLVGLLPATLVAARPLAEGSAGRGAWLAWGALAALLALPSRGLLDLAWAEPWGSTTAGLALLFALSASACRAAPAPARSAASPG